MLFFPLSAKINNHLQESPSSIFVFLLVSLFGGLLLLFALFVALFLLSFSSLLRSVDGFSSLPSLALDPLRGHLDDALRLGDSSEAGLVGPRGFGFGVERGRVA